MKNQANAATSLAEPKTVAILQSNYIPWKGYFDLMNATDEFILYDEVQYTKRDWRNRNKIKTQQGVQWLTIPVEVKGKFDQTISETMVAEASWAKKHWQSIVTSYSKAPHFKEYKARFEALFLGELPKSLTEINFLFLKTVMEVLGIKTTLSYSTDYAFDRGDKTSKLVELCRGAGATHYISGPAAKDYMNVTEFTAHGIGVEFYDYSGYPEYHQLFPPFDHAVTVLDLIFNEGANAPHFMKSFK